MGPLASRSLSTWEGYHLLKDGENQRGLEKMMPSAYRNLSKAMRYNEEGATTRDGKLIAGDFTPVQIGGQAAGFSPASVSEAYETDAAIKNTTRKVNKVKNRLEKRYEEAVENRSDDLSELRQQVRDWNKEHKHNKINLDQSGKKARRRKSIKKEIQRLKDNRLLTGKVREDKTRALERELSGLR